MSFESPTGDLLSDSEQSALVPSSSGANSTSTPTSTDRPPTLHPYEQLKQWSNRDYPAVILLPVRTNPCIQLTDACFEVRNIFDFTGREWSRQRIFLSPVEYPISDNPFESTSFHKLKQELKVAAKENSFTLSMNGGAAHHELSKKFICNQGTRHRPKANSSVTCPEYRAISIKNQRKNSRGDNGKTLPRRRQTCRPSAACETCKVCFSIGVDKDKGAFYIFGGRGQSMHTNHPLLSSREMPVSIRDLTPEQAQIISDVDNAFTNLGVAGNIIFQKYGLALPRSRIRCITGFEHGGDDEGNFVLSPKDKSKGDSHQLIQFLCEKKYDHVIMYHRLTQSDENSERKSELVNYYDYQSAQQESAEELSFGTTSEQQEIHQFALEQRRALRCHPDDLVMIGIAWVTPHERRLFRMFPVVLKTDCTASTNNENRPFFAASGCNSDHGVFVAVRAFLPNERCWTFHWLFQKVFIQLLGTAMQRCNMIITDGDSQEIRTLDSSLEDDSTQMYYRNVHRQHCCWHLISHTWQRYLPKFPGWKAQVCTNIRQWRVDIFQI
jgi:MULE transposase domain